MKTTKLHRRAL